LVGIYAADDFDSKLFGINVAASPEKIFYLKYSRLIQGNAILPLAHHASSPYLNGFGWMGQFTDSTNPIIRDWDKADLRYEYNWYTNKNAPANCITEQKVSGPRKPLTMEVQMTCLITVMQKFYYVCRGEAKLTEVPKHSQCIDPGSPKAYGKPSKVASDIIF
jgi:hypothetical protein